VLEAVATAARRFCGALDAGIALREDDVVVMVAHEGPLHAAVGVRRPLDDNVMGRAIAEGRTCHVPDYEGLDPAAFSGSVELGRRHGVRSAAAAPMLRDGVAIGSILLRKAELGGFTSRQIDLLETFAAQAVIAIENVRLFTALQARNQDLTVALDQQTATSDILRVISGSQTDIQPVFDAIVRSAVRLCGADHSIAARFDGEMLYPLASYGFSPEARAIIERSFPMRPTMENMLGRATVKRAVDNLPDMLADPEYSRDYAMAGGWRSGLAVPMLRDGQLIGAIAVSRTETGAFPDHLVDLLKTFADQAVIAIENVRLFTELQEKNGALSRAHAQVSEALEQQTATSEILHVISRSQTNVQPVFDTIVRSAVRLCGGRFGALLEFDGELLHHVAYHNYTPEALEEVHRIYPMRPSRAMGTGRAILERSVVHIPDVEVDQERQQQALSRSIGQRSLLCVPMLREGAPIGVIVVTRAEPRPFSDNEIELLKTFADQAVIAVENVRLFKALQARTGELTQSVDKLTALGEVSRAVSSTLDVETVLDTIVSRASQLAGGAGCSIYEYDEGAEQFELRATHHDDTAFVEALRAAPLRKGEGLMGRAAEMREPIQISDITQAGAYQSSLRDTLIRFGYRALLAVPLLREDQIIGSLSLTRKTAGEYAPEVIDVLKSFATQSALAIQNARLFHEIADKSRQLEAASRHKSEFLANMSHELRTPLNAIGGYAELLEMGIHGPVTPAQREALVRIQRSQQHLLNLVNNVLNLVKLDTHHVHYHVTDVAMEPVLQFVAETTAPQLEAKRLRFEQQPCSGISVRADGEKLRQILINLLSNAIKFTDDGGTIEVACFADERQVRIDVRDTGCGIADDQLNKIFDPFVQVDRRLNRPIEGTGLGLAISRELALGMGGELTVESVVGAGSTFTLRLPRG
jgi:signal transduction histidine kinase